MDARYDVRLSCPQKQGVTMPYMLMMVEPVDQRRTRTEAEGREVYGRMVSFGEQLRARGQLLAVESLASQEHATRVQVREGRASLTDGPFAEAKEMVGGFFLVNCQSREEALELARQCPAAEWCTVEVRETAPCYEN
jgi:hypothetical protein